MEMMDRLALSTLVNYHLSKGKKYDHIFCDHPKRLTGLAPEFLQEVKGILEFRESGLYVKRSVPGDLTRWRVKETDMTAIVGTKCEIVVEVYKDSKELEGNRGNDISIESGNQGFLDNEDSLLKYLSQELSERGIFLSEKATISVVREGTEWLIQDRKPYFVRACEGKLNVYEKRTLNIVPHCRYLRVSKVGEKQDMWFGMVEPYFFILNSESPTGGGPSLKKYYVGKWRVVECYTKEFETMLSQIER